MSLDLYFNVMIFTSGMNFSTTFNTFIVKSVLTRALRTRGVRHLVRPVGSLFKTVFFISINVVVSPTILTRR